MDFYERLFQEEDINWDEMFLLRVNLKYLDDLILQNSESQLLKQQNNFHLIFNKCLEYLDNNFEDRRVNSALTMCSLLKSIFKKKWNSFSDIISLVCGFKNCDFFFQNLLKKIEKIYIESKDIKQIQILLFLNIILLGGISDELEQNILIDYFNNFKLEGYLKIITNSSSTFKMKHNCSLCLSILIHYQSNILLKDKRLIQEYISNRLKLWILSYEEMNQPDGFLYSLFFKKTEKKKKSTIELRSILYLNYELFFKEISFANFLTFISLIFVDFQDDLTFISLIILQILLESKNDSDDFLFRDCSLDAFYIFKNDEKYYYDGMGSLIRVVFDCLMIFLESHLNENLSTKHFQKVLDLFQLMIQQVSLTIVLTTKIKIKKIKFILNWKLFWNLSLKILNFTNDKILIKKVINLLNISILDGNYFLIKKASHYELIFEIMKQKHQLEKYHSLLNPNFEIIFNLLAEIELKFGESVSDDQMLTMIKQSYDTMLFKSITILSYENYLENPNHKDFFKIYFRNFMQEMRLRIDQSI
eukprot:gene2491-3200_t